GVTPGRTAGPNSVAPGRLGRDGAGMDRPWTIRRAELDDFAQIATLFEAVAAEGRWIGAELPIDHDRRRARFVDGLTRPDEVASFVVVAGDTIVGNLGIELAPYGVAELGMMLADGWRGQGLGSALLE